MRCPSCNKKNAMRAVTSYNGRDWTGGVCRYCGHFVPDVQSKHYDISCVVCTKRIGIVSCDYRHHELDNTSRADVLRKVASMPGSAEYKTKLLKMSAAQLAESWERRHERERQLHICVDCHAKRRLDGVDFRDVETHVRYEVKCYVCKKLLAHVDHPEHHDPAVVAEDLSGYHTCGGECSEKAKVFVKNSALIYNGVKAVAAPRKT